MNTTHVPDPLHVRIGQELMLVVGVAVAALISYGAFVAGARHVLDLLPGVLAAATVVLCLLYGLAIFAFVLFYFVVVPLTVAMTMVVCIAMFTAFVLLRGVAALRHMAEVCWVGA